MNRIYSRVRNSLAIKVIFSTVLLSLVVTGITGSVLNTQLSAGVKDVNLSSALVEARSTIFTAEYRFLLAQGEKDSVVQKVVDDVISSATTLTSNENAREVVFLRSPGNTRENNYEIASNLLDPDLCCCGFYYGPQFRGVSAATGSYRQGNFRGRRSRVARCNGSR